MMSGAQEQTRTPSDWMRWLQSLALPIWARVALLLAFSALWLGALILVIWAIIQRDRESLGSALGLVTVALPISVAVLGLVFGQRSEQRLRHATARVLDDEVVRAIEDHVVRPGLARLYHEAAYGCRRVWRLQAPEGVEPDLVLSVELNVHKVNVGFWIPGADKWPAAVVLDEDRWAPYRHVIEGAQREGYQLNPHLADYTEVRGLPAGRVLLFSRSWGADFLWQPDARLYFAQDLAFFVRGMTEAVRTANPEGSV